MQRRAHVALAGCSAAVAAAAWVRQGGASWAWAAGAAALATAFLAVARRPRSRRNVAAGVACLGLGVLLVSGMWQVQRIACCWAELRAARIPRDSSELKGALAAAVAEARRLAAQGATAAPLPQEAAFETLARVVRSGTRTPGVERGVAVLEPDGAPFAWAGRHRLVPVRDTAELRTVITPFYVALEARRQTPGGGSVVGSVLLDAAPAVLDRSRALSAQFEATHDIALRFYGPGLAPRAEVVFDYCLRAAVDHPTKCDPGGTLFSVAPVTPSEAVAYGAARQAATGRARGALALVLLLLFLAAPAGGWRWLVTLAATGSAVLAFRDSVPLGDWFSPTTSARPLPLGLTASAGTLTAGSIIALVAAATLWRRGLQRRAWNVGAAGLLALAAPYVVRYFGRGIEPPAGGVGFGLWLGWEVAVAAAAMALVLVAAALVRGPAEPRRASWVPAAACAWAVGAAVVGLWLWYPNGAWPEWYTFVWLPALVGVLTPAPRAWAGLGIATVAGTAAALITWGAALEGRLALADRDAMGLDTATDVRAVSLLERMGQAPPAPPPETPGELYAWWRASPLAADSYPASLAVWHRAGEPTAEIRLAGVDLPPSLVAAFVRSPETARGPRVERLDRSPGRHYLLVAPLAGGEVLTVGVGPRTRLIPAARVARFLEGGTGLQPPYQIVLSPPAPPPRPSARVIWTRTGWSVRGERRIGGPPGGVRHVHVLVDLRQPWGLVVRGTLVVGIDIALLAACWLASLAVAGQWHPRVPPPFALLRTSY
ncbi:MAG TPA: hypothetical protein VM736_07055, partial [Gemmatimonadales bacterium]|nr:hypothetical protein [Gemmatimonadales bacterium]